MQKKYTKLSGKIGFDDSITNSSIKNAQVTLYCDEEPAETIEIQKGELPKEFTVDITNCENLEIELFSHGFIPYINLLEWTLL